MDENIDRRIAKDRYDDFVSSDGRVYDYDLNRRIYKPDQRRTNQERKEEQNNGQNSQMLHVEGGLPLTPRLFNEQIILVASLNVSCHGTPASLQFGRSTV
jgi:hypothetical protein